ncbi:hypothetical protein GCM10009647_068790 [Streptomyces sanglieri]
MNGMPPHIAQLVVGHRGINTTMGYKAVYPEEVINGHRAFIPDAASAARARNAGPRRTRNGRSSLAASNAAVSLWATAAGPAAPAAYEHSCLRCSLLRPGPDQCRRIVAMLRQPARPDRRSREGGPAR